MRTKAFTLASMLLTARGQTFVGCNSSEIEVPLELPPPSGLSDACMETFASNITCSTRLPEIAFAGSFPSANELLAVCESSCLMSLESVRNAQHSSCKSDILNLSGESYPATTTIDALLWTYNLTCRRDSSSGEFCAPIFDSWASGDSSNTSCSDCVLGSYQLQLSNRQGYNNEMATNFSSLTSSCGVTAYSMATSKPKKINGTTTVTSNQASVTSGRSCASTYTVQQDDDCHSISKSKGVSTNELLNLNNLQGGCANFPKAGATLCMPHVCMTHTVKQNDTCWSLVGVYRSAFTVSQLVSWNIDINRGCSNLEMLIDNEICVSFPGPTGNATGTRPEPTATTAPVPTNVVNGTNANCGKYYSVGSGDTCAGITQRQSISLLDFYFLNPSVNNGNCSNLMLGYSYCVQAVGDIQTYNGYGGRPADPCVGGTAKAGTTCYATSYPTASVWTFPRITPQNGSLSLTQTRATEVSSGTVAPTVSPRPSIDLSRPGFIRA